MTVYTLVAKPTDGLLLKMLHCITYTAAGRKANGVTERSHKSTVYKAEWPGRRRNSPAAAAAVQVRRTENECTNERALAQQLTARWTDV